MLRLSYQEIQTALTSARHLHMIYGLDRDAAFPSASNRKASSADCRPRKDAPSRTGVRSALWFSGIVILVLVSCPLTHATPTLESLRVNGVLLHYIDQGQGPAVVFVHGGMEDLSAWELQFPPLAKHFRLIAYSRRYNYPNDNPLRSDNHSASIDADDLAALIRSLKLGRVRLVGHSYGAFISMFLALRHPDLVQSLVLSEPPIMSWLSASQEGKPLLDDFMQNMWLPCAKGFRDQQPEMAPAHYSRLVRFTRIFAQRTVRDLC